MVFIDLRSFTAFAESSEPEYVIRVLRQYQTEMSNIVLSQGTLERFSGDGMMIYFNDPIPVQNHTEQAVRMSIIIRNCVFELLEDWTMRGFELGVGIGIAVGYATLGVIGSDKRVTSLSSRLSNEALHGQILTAGPGCGNGQDLL